MQKLQERLDWLTRGLSLGNPTYPDGALSPPTSRLGESYCVLPSSAETGCGERGPLPRTAAAPLLPPTQLAVLVQADPPSLERDSLEAIAAEHRCVLAEVAAARREGHALLSLTSAGAERHEREVVGLLERQGQLEGVVRRLVSERHGFLLQQTARK